MKKILIIPIILIILSSCNHSEQGIRESNFNPEAAVDYARLYSAERNRDYPEYELNCTNFVSQCLVAGGIAMDDGPEPDAKNRLKSEVSKDKWYCYSEQFAENRPPNHSVSTTFVATMDFIEYWTEIRGCELKQYSNTFDGKEEFLQDVSAGNIFLLYNNNNEIEHIGLITDVKDTDAFFCANTINRTDFSICNINGAVYPKLGILSIE